MGTWASSNIMEYVALFTKRVRSALRSSCSMALAEYRALALLADHGDVRPGKLAQALSLKPSAATKVINSLCANKFARRVGGKNGPIRITEQGRSKLSECDDVLQEAVGEFFSLASSGLVDEVVAGSIATAVQHGITRMRNGAYFGEYACLYGFTLSEQIFKDSSQAEGLSFGEFRLLAKICDCPHSIATDLHRSLDMQKSEVSRYASALITKGLVERYPVSGNRSAFILKPGEAAEQTVSAIGARIDASTTMLIRSYNDDELIFSSHLAQAILGKNASKMALR